jgi:leucyl aminopeptidase
MKIALVSTDCAKSTSEVIAVPVTTEDVKDKKERSAALSSLDAALDGLVLRVAAEEKFEGKAEQTLSIHTHGDIPARRIVLIGLGPKAKLDPESVRQGAGRAARSAQAFRAKTIAFALPAARDLAPFIKAATEGFILGAYRFTRYKTAERLESYEGPESAQLLVPSSAEKDPHYGAMVSLGTEVGEATNWARDLVNEPAIVMTPSRLAEAAADLANQSGLKCSVTGRKEIEKLKMGLFLGVAIGSDQEPKLVHMVYEPASAKGKKEKPLALVGKAITFDSGGLSLKTTDGMLDMKTDMAGSASVFGAMRVIAQLKPPFPVHAFVGACENMPGSRAYRPSDVLVSRSGKTVEVTNTDAEGRLVLGDMLTLAKEYKPFAIIDLATLTGACMVALGRYIAGVFGDDEATVSGILQAARAAGEEMWRLPISDLQRDNLKSEIADMKNTGERWGGAINASLFLKEFVGDTPWVHLDIAGPSISPKERGYFGKGATGCGVRTLVEFVRQRS